MADQELDKRNRQFRRNLLAVGLLVGGIYALSRTGAVSRLMPASALAFKELDDPPGFRAIPGGAVTFASVPMFGLEDKKPEGLRAAEAHVRDNLCEALFGPEPVPQGIVPIAYFYDYQCPICRRLTPLLRRLKGVRISWHDLVGLGPASETAARASIAAARQGKFDALHDRLMRAVFKPDEAYVRSIAASVGLDADRLLADMKDPDTTARIWASRATASRFGMVGTPGLVVGRTVVIGDISEAKLNRLVADERTPAARRAWPCQ